MLVTDVPDILPHSQHSQHEPVVQDHVSLFPADASSAARTDRKSESGL